MNAFDMADIVHRIIAIYSLEDIIEILEMEVEDVAYSLKDQIIEHVRDNGSFGENERLMQDIRAFIVEEDEEKSV
jgi:hypothetical protein